MKRRVLLWTILATAFGGASILSGCVGNVFGPGLSTPVIHTVIAKPSIISPGGTSTVTVNATASTAESKCDDDEDCEEEGKARALSYNWSAESGTIDGSGSTVTYTAPPLPGAYVITVEVSDGVGTAIGKVVVTVKNSPPTITSLTATDYVIPPTTGKTQLIVVASDSDGDTLTYTWSVVGTNAGTVSGDGAIANYTAPDVAGTYLVKVVVDDGHGATDTASIAIRVEEPAQ
ncbi:MAG: Ig-like domain-containing protein [bacterium]